MPALKAKKRPYGSGSVRRGCKRARVNKARESVRSDNPLRALFLPCPMLSALGAGTTVLCGGPHGRPPFSNSAAMEVLP